MTANLLWIDCWISIIASTCFGALLVLLVEELRKKGGIGMQVSKFSELVAKSEGKKQQVNIAQIKEILKVANDLLGGELYKLIRKQ